MPPHTTVAPARERAQGKRHERSVGSKHDRAVELCGRRLLGVTCPHRPERARERLRIGVARARERIHLAPFVRGDLREDMRRRAEPVQPQPSGRAAHAQAAVADQPRAQQRSGLRIGIAVGDRKAEALVGHGVLGHPAVDVAAREARIRAQVLAARAAVLALTARPPQPRHTHTTPIRGAGCR